MKIPLNIISRKIFFFLLFVFSCLMHVMAQTDYYYYQGNKIPLTIDENKVCINIPIECDDIIGRIHTNVQTLVSVKDEAFDIFITTLSDYEKLVSLDFWKEDSKSLIVTSCYITEQNNEVCATPYLNVRLKNEQDLALLDSFAAKYKLRIVGNSPLMPLWYIMAVTPNSEINTLECANELYESGYFASSTPDLAPLTDETCFTTTSIMSVKESIELYDLLGRRMDSPSGFTIVVTRYSDGSIRTEKKLFKAEN